MEVDINIFQIFLTNNLDIKYIYNQNTIELTFFIEVKIDLF